MKEILPWDHIECGVTKSFLQREWERAMKGEPTPDCRHKCLDCGVCDHRKVDPVLQKTWMAPEIQAASHSEKNPRKGGRYRLAFTKMGKTRYLSHLELVRLFSRAFRRAGFDLVHSAGYHPMPRISFHCALPVGMESMDESLDMQLRSAVSPEILLARMNQVLPSGVRIIAVQDVSEEKKRPRLRASHFRVLLDGLEIRDSDLRRFMDSDVVSISKKGKEGDISVNARACVVSMERVSQQELSIVMTHGEGPQVRPPDLLRQACGMSDEEVGRIKVIKTRQILS